MPSPASSWAAAAAAAGPAEGRAAAAAAAAAAGGRREEPVRPEIKLPPGFDEPITWHSWEEASDDEAPPAFRAGTAERSRAPRMIAQHSLQCITFEDPSLCRGLPSSAVLAHLGRLLGSSKGDDETFELSTPVERLHIFISHNWSMERCSKFLTLAFYFNFYHSLGCAMLTACTSCLLVNRAELRANGYLSCYCSVSCCIVFMGSLFFCHDIRMPCHKAGPIVFLDKACIHQTNPQLQEQGIHCISAFLNVSQEMLIVYTDIYLRKLWTVYELASMLIMHPSGKIDVVPADLVKLVMVNWIVLTCATCTAVLVVEVDLGAILGFDGENLRFFFIQLFVATSAPFLLFLVLQLRRWAKRRNLAFTTARAFSIKAARCAREGDRPIVYNNISCLMRDYGFVGSDAQEEEALEAFDILARDLIPRYLKASWGRVGIPARCAVAFGLPGLATGLDIAAASSWDVSMQVGVARVSVVLGLPFAYAPLWIAAVSWLAALGLNLRGVREAAWLLVSWLLATLMVSVILGLTGWLYIRATESWIFLAALLFMIFFGLGLSAFIYRPLTLSGNEMHLIRHQAMRNFCRFRRSVCSLVQHRDAIALQRSSSQLSFADSEPGVASKPESNDVSCEGQWQSEG